MPSAALLGWGGWRAAELDELVRAHRQVGGTGPGRRYATQQLNHAIAVAVAAHFQGFARDIHTEIAQILSAGSGGLAAVLANGLTSDRQLDRVNPTQRNLDIDFGRYMLVLSQAMLQRSNLTAGRFTRLNRLIAWRNGVAHQDRAKLARLRTDYREAMGMRSCCSGLAHTMDHVLHDHLLGLLGSSPW